MPRSAWEDDYVSNWHQGSAIVVTSPTRTAYVTIEGNYIENAAQGIDVHADNVLCRGNTVNHGLMGVKLTHGCRNVIVADNLLTHIDLWGLLINPGAASQYPREAEGENAAAPANFDAAIILRGNIISDYGYGHEYWNWGGASVDQASSYAIALLRPQLPGENPPLRDVLIQGNIVHDPGRDGRLIDGKLEYPKPRYRFALFIEPWRERDEEDIRPRRVRIEGNQFHAGTFGIMNLDPDELAR